MQIQALLICGFFAVGCAQGPDQVTLSRADRSTVSAASCGDDMVRISIHDSTWLYIDETPVTVAAYQAFATSAGYTTEAEKFGDAAVFDLNAKAWILQEGANYLWPFGKTREQASAQHPATQVSFNDAVAYCRFYQKRLPTTNEWEAAARYKQPPGQADYPWGNGIRDSSGFRANVWQGIFPIDMRVEDGYAYTSPVRAFSPAPSGLYDMAGNVWEWTVDLSTATPLPGEPTHRIAKGGSFLCEPSWCHGYLTTGSTHTSPETGLFHTGFRCVCDEP